MYENEIEEVSLKCNRLAMDYLQAEKFRESFALLKKAANLLNTEENVPNRLKLLSITLNNIGCYYRKKKQPQIALKYLQDSLELEMQTDSDNINLASSHLNISAILSSLGKHSQALNHSRQALALLEVCSEKHPSLTTNLVISYYNCGAELEHLLKREEALRYYEYGYQLASQELGEDNHLTESLVKVIVSMKTAIRASIDSPFRISRGNLFKEEGKLPHIGSRRWASTGRKKIMHRTAKSFFV